MLAMFFNFTDYVNHLAMYVNQIILECIVEYVIIRFLRQHRHENVFLIM